MRTLLGEPPQGVESTLTRVCLVGVTPHVSETPRLTIVYQVGALYRTQKTDFEKRQKNKPMIKYPKAYTQV